MILDVSERRRAEQDLRLRNRAIESSVNSIMITQLRSEGQRIVYVNPAFERMTGYAEQEVLGRSPRFLFGEDRDQEGIDALRSALREQRDALVLVRNYRKDGTQFWNELRLAPVRNDAGTVTHYISVANDVSERIRYQQEIERNANYDTLTGLPNRNLLNDRLAQAVTQAARAENSLAVLFVDVDHLKRINDSLGHSMGDRVIAAVARRIAEALRSEDTVARHGGDEFVIVLPHLSRAEDAQRVAAKVFASIAAPLRIDAHEFVLTASAGIAMHPRDGADAETLLRNADAALYRAKDDGRNCFRFFTPEMNDRVVQFLATERSLRATIDKEDFSLHYQPIVELASGATVGGEALIRWRRGDGRLAPPAEFVPIAEESGLIVPIGQWAVQAAASQAAAWNRGGGAPLYVSVNLSARQFRDPGLLEAIRAALADARVAPSLLRFEITETTVMQEPERAAVLLGSLKDLGVTLSVDDFGTGYSSLAYLKRFPIDVLKIDRSFVRDLPRDTEDLALCRAIISLAQALELEVVAEGIETAEQAQALTAIGCRFGQGYYFGRPVDPAEFRAP
jgi:diguanylate cyclase (GGDEF)-like protein/PAS domain S-box-containing protein